VTKLMATLGVVASAAVALLVEKARRVADEEGRPVGQVLRELLTRLPDDLRTIPDDARQAAREGAVAARQRQEELERELERIRGAPPASA
jgi:hypothetical protein